MPAAEAKAGSMLELKDVSKKGHDCFLSVENGVLL